MPFKVRDFDESEQKHIVGMFALGFTEAEIAQYFTVTERGFITFLNRRENSFVREKCNQAKIQANVAIRQALFQKAKGGELASIKYWNDNFDKSKTWINGQTGPLPQDPGADDLKSSITSKSDSELMKIILNAIKDGLIPIEGIVSESGPGPGAEKIMIEENIDPERDLIAEAANKK